MGWSHDLQTEIKSTILRGHQQEIDEQDCLRIVQAAAQDFNLGHIGIKFRDGNRKSYVAQAQKNRDGSRNIHQTPRGLNVATVLHEVAHHFPNGFNHYAGWTVAFTRLAFWYVEQARTGRFQTALASGIDLSDMPD